MAHGHAPAHARVVYMYACVSGLGHWAPPPWWGAAPGPPLIVCGHPLMQSTHPNKVLVGMSLITNPLSSFIPAGGICVAQPTAVARPEAVATFRRPPSPPPVAPEGVR